MDGTMIAGSKRGGIGENPMRKGRGDNWGPAPSPHPRTAASRARASARATLMASRGSRCPGAYAISLVASAGLGLDSARFARLSSHQRVRNVAAASDQGNGLQLGQSSETAVGLSLTS